MKELIGRQPDGKFLVRCNKCGRETFPVSPKRVEVNLNESCKGCSNKQKHPLYTTWRTMKSRCDSPNHIGYHNYGGRGITVCDEWLNDFDMFCYHLGPKPTPKHTLDRVDNDYIYCPENCRWSTQPEQMDNSRKSFNAKGYHQNALGRYVANISVNCKSINLGTFDTPEQARAVYLKAKHNKLNGLPIK